MKGRTLGLATLAILISLTSLTGARAQNNLDAGKSPGKIFADTCAVCHRSARGLLKTVPGGSLPGFLRQHYTTGPDMASSLAGYLMSSGAAERVPDPPARAQKNQQAKDGADPSAKQKRQRAPDADGLQQAGEAAPPPGSARQKAAKKGKAGKNEIAEPKPEPDAKPLSPTQAESPKAYAKPEAEAAEPVRTAEPPSGEAARPDQARTEPQEPAKSENAGMGGDGGRAKAEPPMPGRVSRPAGLTLPGFPPPVAEETVTDVSPKPEAAPAAPPKAEIPEIEPAKVDLGQAAPPPPEKPRVETAAPKVEGGGEEAHGRPLPRAAGRKKTAAPPQ